MERLILELSKKDWELLEQILKAEFKRTSELMAVIGGDETCLGRIEALCTEIEKIRPS